MSKTKLLPLLKNIIILFLCFALGRFAVIRMGNTGIWLVAIGVIIFYAVWWGNYQRNRHR